MKSIARWFVALSLTACVPMGPEVGASEDAIVDGTLERARDEVVFLYRLDGAACTGSFISPRVVLTAHHCVAGRSGGLAPASNFRIYVGSSTRSLTAEYRVSEVRPVPNAGLSGREPNDVALLVLSSAARETPLEIARTSPRDLFGQSVTAVGYGQTPSGGSGTKYTTQTTIEGYMGGFIFVPPSVCSGDSGGPLIGADGLVYGVASFIYSPDGRTEPRCGTAPGAYNEIFRFVDFIDGVLAETGTCVPDAVEECNGEDDDCDDAVDEGCTPLGEPCASGDECVGGLCDDTPIGRVCTSACDPLRPAQGCSPGFYCGRQGCNGFCLPGERGEGLNDAACAADTDCASLHCVDPGDGRARCLDPCRADAGLCLAGEVCAAAAGQCGACVPRGLVVGARGLGEPCEDDEECRGDFVCHESAGISACASACEADDDCGDGFECRDALCIRDRRQGVGGTCVVNEDCGDGICAAAGDRRWCTAPCSGADDCPAGFDCTPAGAAMVCAPTGALEGERCEGNADCVTNLCAALPGGESVCTSICDAANACAPGFECTRTGSSAAAVCIPATPTSTSGGGCAAASGSSSGSLPGVALLALVALGLFFRRR